VHHSFSPAARPSAWILGVIWTITLGSVSAFAQDCPPEEFYGPAVHYNAGLYPHDALPGDFNEDGILDLAVASSEANQVRIYRGLGTGGVGNGSFEPAGWFAAGSSPYCLASGDFDEDGILDLVAGNYGASTVSVLRGLGSGGVGTGSFLSPVSFATGGSPFRIATGDFNEDGIIDLAVANNASGNVSVLLGTGSGGVGDGGFGPPTHYPTGELPSGVTVGDFNEDGIQDLAVSNYGPDNVSVLRGRGSAGVGDGTFDAAIQHPAGPNTFCVVNGDVNEDGILDLITANSQGNTVSVLLGLGSGGVGNGGFAPANHFATASSPGVVVLADVDLDGILDISVMNAISNDVSLLLGNGAGGVGDGTFTMVANFPVGSYAISLAGGDFNEDGRIDLVTANYMSQNISVLLSQCDIVSPNPSPVLTDVRDVPNDNGGKVFVTWLASGYDTDAHHTVTGYRVWRRIPPAVAARASATPERSARSEHRIRSIPHPDGSTEYWEALITLPAQRLEGYGYTAPTTEDSTRHSDGMTAFFITAITADPFVFYDSEVDSGYSVDNIKPRNPHGLSATWAPAGVALGWNSVDESDLAGYRVYRGSSPDASPEETQFLGETSDSAFVDVAGATGDHYWVTAIDTHENESERAWVPAPGNVGVGDSRPALSLSGSWPNPATRDLNVVFSLPNDSPASIEVIDLAGRRWASRSVGSLGAGPHVVSLGKGQALRAGVYVIVLKSGDRALSTKVALVP